MLYETKVWVEISSDNSLGNESSEYGEMHEQDKSSDGR